MQQASDFDLGYLLVLAGRVVQHATDQVPFEEGLGSADVNALYELHVHGPIVAGAFAQLLNVRQSTVSAIADRLESRGWMSRTRDTTDRRMVWLALTPAGEQVVQRAAVRMLPAVQDVFGGLTPGAAVALRALLAEFVDPWLAQRTGPRIDPAAMVPQQHLPGTVLV